MHNRMYKLLTNHNCIYDLQFGFRNKHSTSHALLNRTEEIRNALDDNSYDVGVFIDLLKAFDTVDHKILLDKLMIVRSYLTKRKQYVTINGFNSDEVIMHIGIPQGSVLEPLLF